MTPTLALLLAVACGGPDESSLAEFRQEALRNETGGAWRKIDWQKDLKSALEAARKETKPILVVLVVGERGRKNAAEC